MIQPEGGENREKRGRFDEDKGGTCQLQKKPVTPKNQRTQNNPAPVCGHSKKKELISWTLMRDQRLLS
jgi:hypothetical protein